MRNTCLWGLLGSLLAVSSSLAQVEGGKPESVNAAPSEQELLQRDKLQIYENIFERIFDEDKKLLTEPNTQQLAMAGREDLIIQNAKAPGWETCESGSLKDDAIEAIASMAEETRIVIINEAHDAPRHRDFIARLAIALQDKGYSHFAAETFTNPISDEGEQSGPQYTVHDVAYPMLSTGFYSDEPIFGRQLRSVIKAGYTLIAYEINDLSFMMDRTLQPSQSVNIREEAQATNLAEYFMELPENAKMLVHVGYGHVQEGEVTNFDGTPTFWMAGRLKQKTGTDPVTVSQTRCEGEIADPALVTDLDGARYDAAIAHPPIDFVNNRPAWRLEAGDKAVGIPPEVLFDREPTIVEARLASEPADAVPYDRILVLPGEDIDLLLPTGQFIVQGFTMPDRFSEKTVLNVD